MNRARVQMLRDMMEGIPEEQVNLSDYYTKNGDACGTVACIAGWAAIYPPFVEQGLHAHTAGTGFKTLAIDVGNGLIFGQCAAEHFFGIPYETFSIRRLCETGTDKEIALKRLDALLGD